MNRPDGHRRAWTEPVDGPDDDAPRWWLRRSCCECGWRSEPFDTRHGVPRPDGTWHKHHVAVVVAERQQRAGDWYARTGHCAGCGQPGEVCLCTDAAPCACRDMHPMGSGVGVDPVGVFAVTAVSDEQEELW